MIPWGAGIGSLISACIHFCANWFFLAWNSHIGDREDEPDNKLRLDPDSLT